MNKYFKHKYFKNIAVASVAIAAPVVIAIGIADGYSNNPNTFSAHQNIGFGVGIIDAADRGDIVEIRNLLNRNQNINAKGRLGATALIRAVIRGNYSVTAAIIDAGGDVNLADVGGATPLHLAIRAGNEDIAQLLIENGANINAVDSENWTALMRCARHNMGNMAQHLIESGTNIHSVNNQGQNTLAIAAQYGNQEIVNMLQNYGAVAQMPTRKIATSNENNNYSRTSLYNPSYDEIYKASKNNGPTPTELSSSEIHAARFSTAGLGSGELSPSRAIKISNNDFISGAPIAAKKMRNQGSPLSIAQIQQVTPSYGNHSGNIQNNAINNNALQIENSIKAQNIAAQQQQLNLINQQALLQKAAKQKEILNLQTQRDNLVAEITRKALAKLNSGVASSDAANSGGTANINNSSISPSSHYSSLPNSAPLQPNSSEQNLSHYSSNYSNMDKAVITTAHAQATSILADARRKAAEIEVATEAANMRIGQLMRDAQTRASNKMQDADKMVLQKINNSHVLAKQKIAEAQKYVDDENIRLTNIKKSLENEILRIEENRKNKLRADLTQAQQELSLKIKQAESDANKIIQASNNRAKDIELAAQAKAQKITSYADDYVKESAAKALASIVKQKSDIDAKLQELSARTIDESKKLASLNETSQNQSNDQLKIARQQITKLRDDILDGAEQDAQKLADKKLAAAKKQAQLIINNARNTKAEAEHFARTLISQAKKEAKYSQHSPQLDSIDDSDMAQEIKAIDIDTHKLQKVSMVDIDDDSYNHDNADASADETMLSNIAPSAAPAGGAGALDESSLVVRTQDDNNIYRTKVQMAEAIRVPVGLSDESTATYKKRAIKVEKSIEKASLDKAHSNESHSGEPASDKANLYVDDYIPLSYESFVSHNE